MICLGSSVLGLSEVTMEKSAFLKTVFPMTALFPLSRSPPQPNTTISLPSVKALAVEMALERASSVCA